MNFYSLIAVLVLIELTIAYYETREQAAWKKYRLKHPRKYYKPEEEKPYEDAFINNMKFIGRHRWRYKHHKETWQRGPNDYMDLPADVFERNLLGYDIRDKQNKTKKYLTKWRINKKLPTVFDWVGRGAVTSVKDQGFCSSSYAFAAIGALEGVWKNVYKHNNIDLSYEEINECGSRGGLSAWRCWGGDIRAGFAYAIKKGGILSLKDYPSTARNRDCVLPANGYRYAKIIDYEEIPTGDEMALKAAVALYGPVAASLDSRNLRFYEHGIFEDPNCDPEKRNHAVLIVGYGSDNGKDYWICKNSWGANWGQKGYFHILRNNNSHCGIAHDAVFPIGKPEYMNTELCGRHEC